MNTINGGLECTADTTYKTSVVARLDDYCRAVNLLGANLLIFGGTEEEEEEEEEEGEKTTTMRRRRRRR